MKRKGKKVVHLARREERGARQTEGGRTADTTKRSQTLAKFPGESAGRWLISERRNLTSSCCSGVRRACIWQWALMRKTVSSASILA